MMLAIQIVTGACAVFGGVLAVVAIGVWWDMENDGKDFQNRIEP